MVTQVPASLTGRDHFTAWRRRTHSLQPLHFVSGENGGESSQGEIGALRMLKWAFDKKRGWHRAKVQDEPGKPPKQRDKYLSWRWIPGEGWVLACHITRGQAH